MATSMSLKVKERLIVYHAQVPGVRKLPLSAIGIISLLVVVNAIVWATVGIVLV